MIIASPLLPSLCPPASLVVSIDRKESTAPSLLSLLLSRASAVRPLSVFFLFSPELPLPFAAVGFL